MIFSQDFKFSLLLIPEITTPLLTLSSHYTYMEQYFWKTVTRLGQWPWILIWPLALHFLPLWTGIWLSYPTLWDDPYAIVLLVAIFMSYSWWSVVKFLFYKPRPIPQPFKNLLEKIDASSFPSIHTANATVVGLIRSWWWHQSIMAWGDRFLIIPILVGVVGVCSAIALSRIELKKHYPIDVLAGLLFGVLIVALLGIAYWYGLLYWWYV